MFLKRYTLRFLQIKLIETCIKSVNQGNWENQNDKDFTLNNYNKVLNKLKKEKTLFTKLY